MDSYIFGLGTAFWLGILTSISPCPLASNIAAISFIGKRLGTPSAVLLSGIVYTAGRMISYVLVGVILVASALSVPEVAMFLQKYMNRALGPILIIVSLLLLGVLRIGFRGLGIVHKLSDRAESWGIWGAGVLGLLFALSFCPVSAALFFGSLIPLAVDRQSAVIMPIVYGLGTALPVVAFALLIALGARWMASAFKLVTAFERWARLVTGAIFLLVGVYYVLVYLIGLDI